MLFCCSEWHKISSLNCGLVWGLYSCQVNDCHLFYELVWCGSPFHCSGKRSDDRIKLNNFKIVSLNLGVLCFSIWLYPHLHHIIFCSWGISILYSICFLNFSSCLLNWAFKAFCSEFRLPFCIIFKCSIHFLPSTNGVTFFFLFFFVLSKLFQWAPNVLCIHRCLTKWI